VLRQKGIVIEKNRTPGGKNSHYRPQRAFSPSVLAEGGCGMERAEVD
jgi:hypothetical protein